MFNNKNKTILLTGTAGFIGSNFVPYFLEKYPNYNLVNLDLLTYAGDLGNKWFAFSKLEDDNFELLKRIANILGNK